MESSYRRQPKRRITINPLMINIKAFLKLLLRYQKKDVSPREGQLMDMWYDSIDFTDSEREVHSEEEAGKKMWTAINKDIEEISSEELTNRPLFWKRNFYIRLAAACLLCALAFIGYRYTFLNTPIIAGIDNDVIENMNVFANETKSEKIFLLPDSSKVTLDPGSSLFYPAVFTMHDRQVYLHGNGFFDIAHDKTRPFFVHANNIVTKVLGTSFTIKENKTTHSIEVAVITGTVEVRQQQKIDDVKDLEKTVILTQNKKVTYYSTEEKLITGIIDQPKMIRSKVVYTPITHFNYVERSLQDIIPILVDAYGVNISISNDKLRNCVITADLTHENSLFAQLEILCESVDANYLLNNDSIIISGNGCDESSKATL